MGVGGWVGAHVGNNVRPPKFICPSGLTCCKLHEISLHVCITVTCCYATFYMRHLHVFTNLWDGVRWGGSRNIKWLHLANPFDAMLLEVQFNLHTPITCTLIWFNSASSRISDTHSFDAMLLECQLPLHTHLMWCWLKSPDRGTILWCYTAWNFQCKPALALQVLFTQSLTSTVHGRHRPFLAKCVVNARIYCAWHSEIEKGLQTTISQMVLDLLKCGRKTNHLLSSNMKKNAQCFKTHALRKQLVSYAPSTL